MSTWSFTIKCLTTPSDSLRGWTVRGSNHGVIEIFRPRLHLSWGLPSLLDNVFRVSFPAVNWPGRSVNHPLPSGTERKSTAIFLFPLWAFMACYRVNFTVYLLSSPFQVFQLKFWTHLLCPNSCYMSVHLIFPDLITFTGITFIQAN